MIAELLRKTQRADARATVSLATVAAIAAGVALEHAGINSIIQRMAPFYIDVQRLQLFVVVAALFIACYGLLSIRLREVTVPIIKQVFDLTLVVYVAFALVLFVRLLSDDVPFTWGEDIAALPIIGNSGWGASYQNPLDSPPFTFALYGPLYYQVVDLVSWTGLEVQLAARSIGVAAVFVVGGMLFLLAREVTGSPRSGGLASGLFLAYFPFMGRGGGMPNVELLGATFAACAVLVFVRRGDEPAGRWYLVAVALLAVAAILARPPAFVAPAAICLFLLTQRRYSHRPSLRAPLSFPLGSPI